MRRTFLNFIFSIIMYHPSSRSNQLKDLKYYIFIQSCIDEHFGWLYILAIVNNASINIGVHLFFKFLFWGVIFVYPGVELLHHMVVLFLVFWEIIMLFSTVATPIYIPTGSVRGFHFLNILTSICNIWESFWWWPFWQIF